MAGRQVTLIAAGFAAWSYFHLDRELLEPCLHLKRQSKPFWQVVTQAGLAGPWLITASLFWLVFRYRQPGNPVAAYRAAFFVANAPTFKDADEGLGITSHILNQFDIPPGAVRTSSSGSAGGGVAGYEITEWISGADLKNGIYQIKTYGNPAIRQVSLPSADLDAKEMRFIPLDQPPVVTDLSR